MNISCGPGEVRAWTIQNGTKAPQAAGVIHSDFEQKFVCGDIFSYSDLKEYGTENAVKAAGTFSTLPTSALSSCFRLCPGEYKVRELMSIGWVCVGKQRQQGKTYEMIDGDICVRLSSPFLLVVSSRGRDC
jgi:ribosome-binding ATPase YchF (GTP1/OBG family)